MAAANVSSTIASLIGLINRAALEPTLTGPLLLILTRGPENIRQPLQDFLVKPFASDRHDLNLVRVGYVVKTLKWLFALGLTARFNDILTVWAQNHWRFSKPGVAWDFDSKNQERNSDCDWRMQWLWSFDRQRPRKQDEGRRFGRAGSARGAQELYVHPIYTSNSRTILLWLTAGCSDDSVSYYKCDITSSSAVSETASAIRKDVGTPSILINNAGIATAHTILDTSEEFLEKVFRVNLLSHWITIKAFLPAMLEAKKGHIISIASMASYFSCAGLADYAATKAGVLALHEGM